MEELPKNELSRLVKFVSIAAISVALILPSFGCIPPRRHYIRRGPVIIHHYKAPRPRYVPRRPHRGHFRQAPIIRHMPRYVPPQRYRGHR